MFSRINDFSDYGMDDFGAPIALNFEDDTRPFRFDEEILDLDVGINQTELAKYDYA